MTRRPSLSGRPQAPDAAPAPADEAGEEPPKMGWREILSLTLAAYQVLLPLLLALIGALLIAYFLFSWYFH